VVLRNIELPLPEEEEEEWRPDPTGQICYEISVPSLLAQTGAATVEAVPRSFYAGLRADRVSWVILTEFPESADLAAVRATASLEHVKVATGYPEGFTSDEQLSGTLRSGDGAAFTSAVSALSQDELIHLLHAEALAEDSEIPLAMLALPGLRVLGNESRHARRFLANNTLLNGTFSIPDVVPVSGTIVAWKYSATSRILVCVNPTEQRAVALIPCPDAPDPVKGKMLKVFELVMDSTFRRDPNFLRSSGLYVILHAGEVQIFEY
jgi:hypothetical protein